MLKSECSGQFIDCVQSNYCFVDTYAKANKYAKNAEETSNVESASENESRGRKRSQKTYDGCTDWEGEYNNSCCQLDSNMNFEYYYKFSIKAYQFTTD